MEGQGVFRAGRSWLRLELGHVVEDGGYDWTMKGLECRAECPSVLGRKI